MRGFAVSTALFGAVALSGCVASTLANVVTAPEKRGREIRKREEELGKLDRRYDKELKKCRDGNRRACDDASGTYAEMQVLARSLPAEPD